MHYKALKTERLLLRALEPSDSLEILFLRSDNIVNTYVERPRTESEEDALEFIQKITNGIKTQSLCYWSINLKGKRKTLGTICLWNFSDDRKTAEIGYDLHPDYHGKGIMSEALKAVLEFGFNELLLDKIEGFTHKSNESSTKLLLKYNFNQNKKRVDSDNTNNIIFELRKSNFLS
jgi:ribosomal-protein-alanine N-acetyltransferase